MSIAVLGDGAWGTAIANLLASNGHSVNLWCYSEEVADQINTTRYNRIYLKNIKLHENIVASTNIGVIEGCEYIFEAVPVKFLRGVFNICLPYVSRSQKWIILSKGIESSSFSLPTTLYDSTYYNPEERDSLRKRSKGSFSFPMDILDDVLGFEPNVGVISGPSFAIDVANKQPTGVMLASVNKDLYDQVGNLINNEYFKTYYTTDVIGTQFCAAIKNVIALLIGMLDGAGYQENTKALILTECLKEMALLNNVLGGKQETVYGLAGIGDLLLTTMSNKSRNFSLGQLIGKGCKLDDVVRANTSVPESLNTVISLNNLVSRENIDLPIFGCIYDVVYGKKELSGLVVDLMK